MRQFTVHRPIHNADIGFRRSRKVSRGVRPDGESLRVPLHHFEGQFILGQSVARVPNDWRQASISGWTLATHPALPSCGLLVRDGTGVGWLVGHAIDGHGVLVSEERRLPFERAEDLAAANFEKHLDEFGGRYVCILLAPNIHRLYMDPGGTLGVVYAQGGKIAGSTNTLLEWSLDGEICTREPYLGWLDSNQFYPAGLTADPDVERVLPNHFLDLDRWRTVRHRLRQPVERIGGSAVVEETVELIARRLASQVEAVTNCSETYMGLTAGRDSRMVLAASKNALDRMTFITFAYPDLGGARDVSVAQFFARRYGLRQKVIPVPMPADSVKSEYLVRIGYAGHWGKARDFYAGCRAHLDTNQAFLTGFAAEVGRAFYWKRINWRRDAPTQKADVNARTLLEAMRLPLEARFEQAMERWLEGLAPMDTPALLDQAYLEQRLGCWAAPHMYGAACFAVNLTPFCHREIFDGMLRLPVEFRNEQQLVDGVLNVLWPELQRVPYQQKAGSVGRVSEAARRLKRAIKSHIP